MGGMNLIVEYVPDPVDPTSPFVWAITYDGGEFDGGVVDRFDSREEAEAALPECEASEA